VLQANNISKSFGGVPVLRDVCFDVRAGEVHALAGANGAGKSTLVNIISGVLQRDSGVILWDGKRVELNGPRNGRDLGISFVHQELALVPQLSVGENIFLGRTPYATAGGLGPDLQTRSRIAGGARSRSGPACPAGDLGIAEQQLVEIARAWHSTHG
jgi:ribose transport system ATP-binding protein